LARVIPPSQADVAADLAEAALRCPALVRARKLAEWVGPGKELTSSGVLRPALVTEACRMMDIRLPRARVRSALDVHELMRDWATAVDAGFIVAEGRRAHAASAMTADPDAERVLNGWVQAAAEAIGAEEPCAGCLAVLLELSQGGRPLSLGDLANAVAAVEPDVPGGEPCPDCGRVHGPADLLGIADLLDDEDPGEPDPAEHAEATVEALLAFGAADSSGGLVRPTPLGSLLATAVFASYAPPPDSGAGTVVALSSDVPLPLALKLAGPWLAARPADTAVRELLAFAESAGGAERMAALAFADEIGPDAAAAWREWAGQPGFGAYARQWLADHGEPVTQDAADEGWLATDALSILLDTPPDMLPPLLLAEAVGQQTGLDMAGLLVTLRASGHPAAAQVAARLTGRPEPVSSPADPATTGPARAAGGRRAATRPRGDIFQLKISLRGVSNPPVWRRVAVPGDIALADLHAVIARSMGWNGGHLHVFETGSAEYGTTGYDLGHIDDSRVPLSEVLSVPGTKLRYTYDFGDDWRHDVKLEKILPEEPGVTYPFCLAGKGACPPDDCGGAWGYAELKDVLAEPGHERHQDMLNWMCLVSGDAFDPKAFSAAEANARLGRAAPVR